MERQTQRCQSRPKARFRSDEWRRTANPSCGPERRLSLPASCRAAQAAAEVEHLVRPGEIDADHIHTPGIFVKRMIPCPAGFEKRIEQRTVRKRPAAAAAGAESLA